MTINKTDPYYGYGEKRTDWGCWWVDENRWNADGKPVKGHLCEGLKRLQAAGGGCIPEIKPNGIIKGCDDEQSIEIIYCPMCGVCLET